MMKFKKNILSEGRYLNYALLAFLSFWTITIGNACTGGQDKSGKTSDAVTRTLPESRLDTIAPTPAVAPSKAGEPGATQTIQGDTISPPQALPPGTPVLVEVIVGESCRTAPLFINDQPALVLAQIKNVKRIQLIAGTTYRFRIGKMEKTVTITPSGEAGKYQVTLPCE